MSEYRNYIYVPADGEEVPDPNAVLLTADAGTLIAGQPATVLSVILSEPLVTAGTIYYIGTQSGPEKLLPMGSVINHQYIGWPVPTDTMPEVPAEISL